MLSFPRFSLQSAPLPPSSPSFSHALTVSSSSMIAFFALLACLSICTLSSDSWAGACPCQWVVAVNGDSLTSRTIANHYCHARNIPPQNVVVLTNVPLVDQIDVDQFRERILIPLLDEIEKRGLSAHIQGVAYSADFPTAIDIQSDIAAVPNRSQYLTPVASINGLTYLFRFVLGKQPAYIGFDANLYAARHPARLLSPVFTSDEQTTELKQLLKDSKHQDIALMMDQLCESNPKEVIYPMQYIAAQQWALAGNSKKAIQRIEKAIRGGWSYREHLLNDPGFVSLLDNDDFQRIAKRSPELPFDYLPTRGFDARMFYTANTLGSNNSKVGVSYLLSMALAVTTDLGQTPSEAIENLKTSIGADYTFPKGAFLFSKTEDVRTKAREPQFNLAIDRLKSLGMDARMIETQLPAKGETCSGVMLGLPEFFWWRSGATMLPGALADNLTSYGGAMTTSAQTKATELLRNGAAASSGAVTEPFSIPHKFPHAMTHVAYVEGLTAAEAFYSSVTCPYQLLIIGDPLCQPYCKAPKFTVEGFQNQLNEKKSMMLKMVTKDTVNTTEPETLQWLLDGVVRGEVPFDLNIRMNLDSLTTGVHEVRFISKSDGPLEHRFERSFWITCGPDNRQLHLNGPETFQASGDKPLTLTIDDQVGEHDIDIVHDSEVVATVVKGTKSVDLPVSKLGHGPIRLHAIRKEENERVASKPITLTILRSAEDSK